VFLYEANTMPFCEVAKQQTSLDDTVDAASSSSSSNNKGIKIFYKTYGHGPTKVLLIIGNNNHQKIIFLFQF
jgi:hypothetical protein